MINTEEITYTTDLVHVDRKTFQISATTRVVIQDFKMLSEEGSKRKLDMRIWYSRDGDNWFPTRRGLSLRIDDIRNKFLPMLIEICKNGD